MGRTEGEDKRGVKWQSHSVSIFMLMMNKAMNHRSEMDTVQFSKASNEQMMNGVVHGLSVDCSHDHAFPLFSFNVSLI